MSPGGGAVQIGVCHVSIDWHGRDGLRMIEEKKERRKNQPRRNKNRKPKENPSVSLYVSMNAAACVNDSASRRGGRGQGGNISLQSTVVVWLFLWFFIANQVQSSSSSASLSWSSSLSSSPPLRKAPWFVSRRGGVGDETFRNCNHEDDEDVRIESVVGKQQQQQEQQRKRRFGITAFVRGGEVGDGIVTEPLSPSLSSSTSLPPPPPSSTTSGARYGGTFRTANTNTGGDSFPYKTVSGKPYAARSTSDAWSSYLRKTTSTTRTTKTTSPLKRTQHLIQPMTVWWTRNISPNMKNWPKIHCRVEPTTTLKIRKTFRPLKTIVQLGADFNTQLSVWQFKSSWEDALIGGKLTLAGRELQFTKSWQFSVGAMEDLVTRLRLRAAVDLQT